MNLSPEEEVLALEYIEEIANSALITQHKTYEEIKRIKGFAISEIEKYLDLIEKKCIELAEIEISNKRRDEIENELWKKKREIQTVSNELNNFIPHCLDDARFL